MGAELSTLEPRAQASTDPRARRSRQALRQALAAEIEATHDLSQVTVTALCERAGITRRTFYLHYADIPSFVDAVENEAIEALRPYVCTISEVTLDELSRAIEQFLPCPGAIELLEYFEAEGAHLGPLLGEGGDPAFLQKITRMVREVVEQRALSGFSPAALAFFDYYLTYAISAQVCVLARWLSTGHVESADTMARIMTALTFVRPGDLYGSPIPVNLIQAVALKETHHAQ